MNEPIQRLNGKSLKHFRELREVIIEDLSNRFIKDHPETYIHFGDRGLEACREDIAFTIEFLQPAVEFGIVQPFINYIIWLREVLSTRGIPSAHLTLSLEWMELIYKDQLPAADFETVHTVLAAGRQAIDHPGNMVSGIDESMPEAWSEFLELEEALLSGDSQQGMRILRQRMEKGASLLDVELHLLQPAMYQIGRDWQANRVSVAQEHLATATATTLMARLAGEMEPDAPLGARLLLSCVSGNHHAMGLRIVGDAFEMHGWDVRFLGPDVPTPSLVDQVKRWQPDLVGLSISMPHHLRAAREAMKAIRSACGDDTPALMLGGLAINALPSAIDVFAGVATATDAEKALHQANSMST